jgi:[acyl-carrier-protein] S-malonyltransferase
MSESNHPRAGLTFLFPGQGSQKIGMGQDWVESFATARSVFEEADEVLGFSISRLCWEGPSEELQLTANLQPAILTASIAVHRVLVDHGVRPSMVAGHSLGEYSALVAAECLTLADALRLVRRRGQLMQEAVPVGVGAMAAILNLPVDDVYQIARDASTSAEICTLANLNSPDQSVVAGHREAVERAVELATERGARRAILLPVSAPFHSPLMAPAREGLTPDLDATQFADPIVPVVCNVDAVPVTTGDAARDALMRQIDSPVRWVESVEYLAGSGGTQTFVEVGPGSVLTGLVRKILDGVRPKGVGSPEGLPELVAELMA